MDSLNIEYMNLDTDGKKSLFYNDSKFKIDSIVAKSNNLNQLTNQKNYNLNLDYKIYKDYNSSKIKFYIKRFNTDFFIEENEIPDWELTNEFLEIANYKCQKAHTNYKGREWTAWFTNEIPLSDGPYKFYGLPGLVVQIQDKNKIHTFSLIHVINIENPYLKIPNKAKLITRNQFDNIMKKPLNLKTDISFTNVTSNGITVGLTDGNFLNFNIQDGKNLNNNILKKTENTIAPIEINSP